MAAENSYLITIGINDILEYIKINKSYFKK